VRSQDDDQRLGVVKDVLQPSSQDVYVVRLDKGGETMIPAVSQFIRKVDLESRCIWVHLIPGMIEEQDQ
jgi:16S rRNA processing protein RimM